MSAMFRGLITPSPPQSPAEAHTTSGCRKCVICVMFNRNGHQVPTPAGSMHTHCLMNIPGNSCLLCCSFIPALPKPHSSLNQYRMQFSLQNTYTVRAVWYSSVPYLPVPRVVHRGYCTYVFFYPCVRYWGGRVEFMATSRFIVHVLLISSLRCP